MRKDQINYESYCTTSRFIKYHVGLLHFLTPNESHFILHLLDIDFSSNVYSVPKRTKQDYMDLMSLNKSNFDSCVRSLSDIELIKVEDYKTHVEYVLDKELYYKLVYIFSRTNNVKYLQAFNEKFFTHDFRSTSSITSEEIEMLNKPKIMEKLIREM